MKAHIWAETEQRVRQTLAEMPEMYRLRLKEIAESDFPALIEAARRYKSLFEQETQIGELNRLAARYARSYVILTRVVGLRCLGVPLHVVQGQVQNFLRTGKGATFDQVPQSTWHEVGGSNEETLTQSAVATG